MPGGLEESQVTHPFLFTDSTTEEDNTIHRFFFNAFYLVFYVYILQ